MITRRGSPSALSGPDYPGDAGEGERAAAGQRHGARRAPHPVAGGRLAATTVETVRFTRPERVGFRLVRGPVPHVVESFVLTDHEWGARLAYDGVLGTDLWGLGHHWGQLVAGRWEETVAGSPASVREEAERRARL